MSCAHLGGKHPSNGPKFIYLWSCNMAWAGAWVFHFKWNGPNIRTGKLQTFAYVFLRFFFFLFQLCCKLPDSKHTLFEHWTWMKVSVVCPGNIMCKRRRRFTHRHNDRKLNNGTSHSLRTNTFLCLGKFSPASSSSNSIHHHAIIALYCRRVKVAGIWKFVDILRWLRVLAQRIRLSNGYWFSVNVK